MSGDAADIAGNSKIIPPPEFHALMAGLGPFERNPVIAIACSGGPDSMALTLLADDWARNLGGRAIALIVDHGLREESAAEAKIVQERLKVQNIESEILTRRGGKITGDIQAKARDARYSLMTQWCAHQNILHLLFAHHQEDQAETLLIRLERGSGVFGMSGMARIRETNQVRILRPTLGLSRSRLRATIDARKVRFVEDPSNLDARFARVRIRQRLEKSGDARSALRLSETASRMGAARAVLEDMLNEALARTCRIFPEGYCLVDWAGLASTPIDIRRRVLASVLTCVGARAYTPRFKQVCTLAKTLTTDNGKPGVCLSVTLQYPA
ncbi:MAG: tRNA lysidine(34) synthetase TilS, partial [Alphaproteobacteria bacterium]|nr:tRNA lysidine(34) synthetase TilS [Alphaproteobacteria bacterium]